MNAALFELVGRNLYGGLVRRARRLRQPRYLVAFLISVAYFGLVALPGFLHAVRPPAAASAATSPNPLDAATFAKLQEATQVATLVVALGLAAGATLLWIFASAKPALRLSEADVDLLLPAPLSRRQVIEYSIWKQQAGILFGALVITLIRGYGSPGTRLAKLFGAWALLTIFSLHAKGVSLWKARLGELPAAAARRRIAFAVAVGAAFWLTVALEVRAAAHGAAGWLDAGEALHRLASAPPPLLAVLVAPLRVLAATVLAGLRRQAGGGGFASFDTSLPGAAGEAGGGWVLLAAGLLLAVLVVAHYAWVVRSRASFEDAALDNARRQASRRSRRPLSMARPKTARARQQEPFRLPAAGPPATAIYWKNLLIASRTPLSRRAWRIVLPGLAVWAAGAALGAPLAFVLPAALMGLMLMVLVPPFSGLNLRHDLRMDLLQLEVLRCWPLPGWRLVAAELLAPATTAVGWTLTGFGILLGALLACGGEWPLPAPGSPSALDAPSAPGDPALDAAHAAHAPNATGGAHVASAAHATGSAHAAHAVHGAAFAHGVDLAALRHGADLTHAALGGGLTAALALGSALLIAGVPVILLSSGLQNVAALLLPGWMMLGTERRAGSGLAGQRLLMLVAQALGLLLGVLPGLLAAGAAALLLGVLGLPLAFWQAPLLALVACLPVLAEVGVLVRFGGALWDRLDPAQEMLNPET